MAEWKPAGGEVAATIASADDEGTMQEAIAGLGLDMEELSDFSASRFEVYKMQMLTEEEDWVNEAKWTTLYMAGFIEGASWRKEHGEDSS